MNCVQLVIRRIQEFVLKGAVGLDASSPYDPSSSVAAAAAASASLTAAGVSASALLPGSLGASDPLVAGLLQRLTSSSSPSSSSRSGSLSCCWSGLLSFFPLLS